MAQRPADTEAYRRLAEAIRRRRAWLSPTLGFAAPNPPDAPPSRDPELTDELADDASPVPFKDALQQFTERGEP